MISPLTKRADTSLLQELNPNDIAWKWQKSMGIDVGPLFRSLHSIEYWQCNETGLRWYSPNSATGARELYEQLEKFDWYYMKDKWEFRVALGLLENESQILEVGVGEGYFLKAAKVCGHYTEGVELNPKAALRSKEQGFEIHQMELEQLKKQTYRRFDAICSFQVLEHVPNPREFIENMISLLRPTGKLIISVPNGAVMRRIDLANQNLLNQPPHHMSHWDERVFRSLEDFLPVRVKSIHREPLAKYHIDWIVNGYLRGLIAPFGSAIARILANRYTTLPLKWLMLAGARKWFPGHTLLVELECRHT